VILGADKNFAAFLINRAFVFLSFMTIITGNPYSQARGN
jgi:hypothetical protein